MSDRTFYACAISFISGIAAVSAFRIPIAPALACLVACSAVAFATRRGRRRIWALAAAAFCFGALRMDVAQFQSGALDAQIGRQISFEGVICGEPEEKEAALKFCFKPDGQSDKVLVSAPRYPGYSFGDRISVSGSLELPEPFEAYEGGPTFDYASYLGKDGVRFLMRKARVESLGENRADPVTSALFATKHAFLGNIERLMPEPYSSLTAGILLGEKGFLSPDLGTAFKRTGLTHILVLSGSNVSVVAGGLMKAFESLPSALGQSLGATAIVLFAVMTGASATTVRASIMALILILAGRAGRRYDIVRALSVAAMLMLAQNPRILVFDVSFQLSFLSTLALIFVSPMVDERLHWITDRWGLRGIFSATIATQIFTMPFILHVMGEISVVALVPNVLVLPVIPWAMLGGFLTGTAGFAGAVALPFAWATDAALAYAVSVVSAWSALPFATIRLSFGEPFMIAAYAAYAALIFRWRKKNSSRQSSS